MASSDMVITEALQSKGIKKDKDVEELYLSNRNLNEMIDLKRFRYLTKLWLNGNKLREVNFLSINYHLCELYLHDNQLSSVSGCLQHLTCLVVLTLHNNQLTKLETVTKEFEKMKALSVLNLFNNPVAQEADYRMFVIRSCPSLTLLDRSEVTREESEMALQDEERVHVSLAFGRKSEGPPSICYPSRQVKSASARPATSQVGNNKSYPTYENPEDAVNMRLLKKSLTMYSVFDWSRVPRIGERKKSSAHSPRIITHVYR
ncbi:leucine-rich repeat-containing protein 72-like isoform X2 [Physella acuta]|uniref:leucine-rich repeat-containing protein 72-like isoform X2 n=1 Tax=Physella acuta TaxID=109671 RepID=UPI0027DE8519|nr:leucine-rich repeat-containing protein 72-like isoform X2 [Physella acuta]